MSENAKYKVERPIYSIESFSKDYVEEVTNVNILNKLKCGDKIRQMTFWSTVQNIFPFPFALASFYTFKFFLNDIIAGLTLFVFHIPQGMAFGLLGGLQPINGLYASFYPPLIYLIFGTSRHISLGSFSIMALVSSVSILREANIIASDMNKQNFNGSLMNTLDYEMLKLQISTSTTLLAGLVQLLMGLLRFGCIINYVNDSLIGGFTTATAFHIVVSQLPEVLGYAIPRYSGFGELPYKLYTFGIGIRQTHWITVGISIFCCVILILFIQIINPFVKKKFDVLIPIQLILVIIGTIISYYLSLTSRLNIKIIGPVPKGLPLPLIPDVKFWPSVFLDGVLLGVFGSIMNSAIVKMYSVEFSYEVNFNKEFVAYGFSNIFGSFFQCIMSGAAMARSAVAVEIGMKSQIASLISCILMLFILVFLGPLFETLPRLILSSIIITSLKSNFLQILKLSKIYKQSKYDFDIWMVSFCATLLLNVPTGLIVGFIFSLLTVFMRFHNPKSQILGQLPQTNIYRNIKTYKDAIEIPGIKIFRYDTPIYFANAENFQRKIFKKCGRDPRKLTDILQSPNETVYHKPAKIDHLVSKDTLTKTYGTNENVKFIILDLSSVNYVDSVALRIFENIYTLYREIGVFIFLAEPNNRVIKLLSRSNFADEKFEEKIFVSIHDAVLKALSMMMSLKENKTSSFD